jgi:hypothetical protein
MRHVYICQAQACLAHGRATFEDHDAVVYLVDDRSLQRKLSKEGVQRCAVTCVTRSCISEPTSRR